MKQGCECNGEMKSYRWTLTVQSPGGTADAGGHVDLTDDSNWSGTDTIKANILTRGGKEGRVFDQVQAEVTHIIQTPSNNYSRSIHPNQRLVWGTRKFNITAAYDKDEMRSEVQIHAVEVV